MLIRYGEHKHTESERPIYAGPDRDDIKQKLKENDEKGGKHFIELQASRDEPEMSLEQYRKLKAEIQNDQLKQLNNENDDNVNIKPGDWLTKLIENQKTSQ